MKAASLYSSFPYAALGILIVGVLVRYFIALRKPETIAANAREALQLLAGGRLWQASLALLFVFHLAGLLFPRFILNWNAGRAGLYSLEALALLLGLAALVGGLITAGRNLGRTGPSFIIEISDTAFLALLLTGILSGLLMAVTHRWGSTWGAMILTPYLMSLLQGNPEPSLMTDMPFLVRLHVFSSFAALAILPATRLASVPVPAIYRVITLMRRPLAAAARIAEGWIQRHNPAGRIWPEED
jgi:nitrate reductase gamma subunit